MLLCINVLVIKTIKSHYLRIKKKKWKSNNSLNFQFPLISGKQVKHNHTFPKAVLKDFNIFKDRLAISFTSAS